MASEPAQAASWRSELIARLWLTAGVLLGYAPLLGFDKLIITDDGFVSDIWNGELPVRAYLGQVLREHGHLLTWYDGVCSGAPSVGLEEPLSVSAYTALSPGAATCALFLTWVLIAAHGSYWLARRSGASRAGAVLSGLAFAMSGYLVTQLKHMSLVGTCVWLPTGLALLDTGLGPERTWAQRALRLSLFGCVFGEQVLCGFPQSIYICGLVYGAYALQRVLRNPPVPGETFQQRVLLPLMAAGLAVAVGAAAGAISLLPLAALGAVSDRSHGNTWEWATQLNYDPKDLVMFVAPYANGDASDGTFHSKAIFWEDYGYVGLATFLLALYAIVRERRSPHVRFFALWAVIALLFVLGPATPVFRIAFEVLPGFKLFRFPQRFMIVVELCLSVLAALGLTRVTRDLTPHVERLNLARVLPIFVFALVFGTLLDLISNQTRQNPIVDAAEWLRPPVTVDVLRNEPGRKRLFTPFHMDLHHAAYVVAHGWADLVPYYKLRDMVQPNTNLYWGMSTADCYGGIGARWHVDVWGDHSRGSLLMYHAMRPNITARRIETRLAFPALLRTYGVTHVLSPFAIPQLGKSIPLPESVARDAHVYRVPGSTRVRVVEHATLVKSNEDAVKVLLNETFDPDELVVLHDAPASVVAPPAPETPSALRRSARLERDGSDFIRVRARAPNGGFLVLSDTFFPDWHATVDGKPAEIYRANISVRAVALARGEHVVEFRYEPQARARGMTISLSAITLLLLGVLASGVTVLRQRRRAA